MPEIVVVTAAVILDANLNIMVAKRYKLDRPNQHNKWYFPGGKLEFKETLEDCIKREIQEELSCSFFPTKQLTTLDFGYTEEYNKQYILVPFLGDFEGKIAVDEQTGNSAIEWIHYHSEWPPGELMHPVTQKIFDEAWRLVR